MGCRSIHLIHEKDNTMKPLEGNIGNYLHELGLENFFLTLLIYFEREREHASNVGAERERRERIPSRLHAASTKLDARLNPTNHKIVT